MPQPNPAALQFLAHRRSRSAKLFMAPVPTPAQLTDILTIAVRVPDHGKLEPWRLVVLSRDALARIATLAETHARSIGADAEKIAKARGQYDLGLLAVVVIASPRPSEKVPVSEQNLSAGALCMNIVNAAEAAGWGACWLSGWPAHDPVFTAAAFGTAPQESVAGIIHIATPANDGPDRPRPDVARITQWISA